MYGLADSMHDVVDRMTELVPGVTGALIGSADGFALCSRLPDGCEDDPATIAAMAAAAIGLSSRLVRLVGEAPAAVSHQRSVDGQVLVFAVDRLAVLAVLASHDADSNRIAGVGREAVVRIRQLLTGAAPLAAPSPTASPVSAPAPA